MQKIWFLTAASAVTLLMFSQTGCKTSQDYADERAEKASTHFQAAKFRELQQGKALTLKECIGIALKNNLQIRISELEIQVQQELETAEALGMLPRFDINNRFTARSNTPASGSQKLVATGKSYGASYSEEKIINYLNVDLLFSLLDFGLTFYNTRQQADRVLLSKQRKERVAQNLALDVVKAYFKVASAQRAIKMTDSLLEQCRGRYEQIYNLSKQRKITPARAFDESRRFIAMEKKLTDYQRSYENSCVELRTLLGYYPSANIVVDESVLDRLQKFDLPDIATMEQIAILQRPELYEADIQKHINMLECRKMILMMFPNVQLYADWSNSNNKFLYNNSWFELGLRAAYNLLKLPQHVAKYKAYSSQVEAEEMRSYAQAVAVMAQVRIAHGNFENARSRYQLDRKVYNSYDDYLQAALKNRVVGGTLSQLDIDHIRLVATQTNIDCLISLGEYYVAYYRLLNVMGLKNLDSRTAEELREELLLAADRIKDQIKEEQNSFRLQQEQMQRDSAAYRAKVRKKEAEEADARLRTKIRSEIDVRIKTQRKDVSGGKKK